MNWADASALLLSLGIGGAVGAALAVLAAGGSLAAAWDAFTVVFRAYTHGKTDPETVGLNQSFEAVRQSVQGLMSAVHRLRRVLRLK